MRTFVNQGLWTNWDVRTTHGLVRCGEGISGRDKGGTPIAARCDASGRGTAGGR